MNQIYIEADILAICVHEAEGFEVVLHTGDDLATLHDLIQHGHFNRSKLCANLGHTRVITRPNFHIPRHGSFTKPLVVQLVVSAVRLDVLQREVRQITEVGITLGHTHAVWLLGKAATNNLQLGVVLGSLHQKDGVGGKGISTTILDRLNRLRVLLER